MRDGVEEALKQLKGRWKLVILILFHLFGAEDQR
jgi:DNA-binding HxlR family transcriptional regulator